MATLERFQLTGKATCRICYPQGLFEKRMPKGSTEGTLKYDGILLIPKEDSAKVAQVQEMYNKAFKALKDSGYSGKTPASLNPKSNCLVDGDVLADNEDGKEQFRGYLILKMSSPYVRPRVFDLQKRVILNGVPDVNVSAEDISPEELKDGDIVHATVSFWTYNKPTVQGIGCNPIAFLRVAEGEPICGAAQSTKADDYFGEESYE